jgi:archaellum biogenesis ATPase FlaH
MNLILHRILDTQDLNTWAKLKRTYFKAPYITVYDLISRFYEKNNKLPSFNDLDLIIRTEKDRTLIKALSCIKVPEDLDTDIIFQAMLNEYAQDEVLFRLDSYLDELAFKDVAEIIDDLNDISLDIEERTETSEQVIFMNEFATIDEEELFARIPLGLNNDFDVQSLGAALSEMFMFGGYRGSGKSLICSNIACNQYHQGNSSLYFSIEMRAREIFNRNMSILSGVDTHIIKSGKLKSEDMRRIAKVRAEMVKDGDNIYNDFVTDKDFSKFEQRMLQQPITKKKQLITIDNPRLTLSNIDATIGSFKSKLDDNLKVVIVDYINQIHENDAYRWDVQTAISKKLKELARKYEVVMVTPYQTDKEGETRFAKGLLDSPDWAFTTKPHTISESGEGADAIEFTCVKARGDRAINFTSAINWDTLKIDASTTPTLTKPIRGAKHPKEYKPSDDDLVA